MFGMSSIIVIGAGAYGTALAIVLSRNNQRVFLWGHNVEHVKTLQRSRCNQKYLPNIYFPSTLHVEGSLSVGLSICRDIFIAVPSYVFTDVLMRLKPYLRSDSRIVLATKGLEVDTGRFLKDVTTSTLGPNIPCAVISGPTFAYELAVGLPTAVSLVSTDSSFCYDLKKILRCNRNFRVYIHTDFIGIQLASVIKNIIAIASGISDGIGFGSNARTMLITRGLAEMSRLGIAMGAQLGIFTDMAGLGDLILTCTDNQSRNRRFGILLGQGLSVSEAQKNIGRVIEGIRNTKEIYLLSVRYVVDMPITNQIYQVLYENKSVYDAAMSLLDRKQ